MLKPALCPSVITFVTAISIYNSKDIAELSGYFSQPTFIVSVFYDSLQQ